MAFFKTAVASFYAPETYRAVRNNVGHGLGYSFLLVLALALFNIALYAPTLHRAHTELFVGVDGRLPVMDDALGQIAHQWPRMVIDQHVMKTEEPGPHMIRVAVNLMGEHAEGEIITIDTTGATTHNTMKTPILITSNELITKTERETRLKSFKELIGDKWNAPLVVTPEVAKNLADQLATYIRAELKIFYAIMGSICLVLFLCGTYIARILLLLILSLIGMLLASILRQKLDFAALMRLSAVAYTPVAVLDVLIGRLNPGNISMVGLLFCGTVMLLAALYASRDATQG